MDRFEMSSILSSISVKGLNFCSGNSVIDPSWQSSISFHSVVCFLFYVSVFMITTLGVSSQFTPTRWGCKWLTCMRTRAFTSVLTETAIACHCLARFPSMHRGAVKNWKRWQICYPYVTLRIPMKQHLFNVLYRETIKIIGSFLSTCPSRAHTIRTHTLFGHFLYTFWNQWHLLIIANWIRQMATCWLWWKGVCEAAKGRCTAIAAFM